jgi:hypothetical protein
MQTVPWTVALPAVALCCMVALWALRTHRSGAHRPLPTEWPLAARPVFTTEERRVYRLLREALPHHVILAKLPLVRLCQPASSSGDMRYWYDLLGSLHVGFAVCSANGRVLAALDLEADRSESKRSLKIKQSVLTACRIRHLRCNADRLPTAAELQLLVPQHSSSARAPQGAPTATLHEARDTLASTVATRRAERVALWQDSTFFQDSFFALDSRLDASGSDFINLNAREGGAPNPMSKREGDLSDMVSSPDPSPTRP